ncbi:hypothetical protein [Clostridium tyrobutyricum]|jgi:hypothetical protein|uniref:YobI family P-loop NTPase n=1 Tax=Clostridium tyrobutyricum TaxID=1519 RepID=UPI00242CE056|nr:hypothetical protein [Clostridium tyrobutyricum]MCH4199425.1 hypothetical protein [Clostridium tyrobutyricum]
MDKIHFEKLTPAKDTKLGIYEYALNFVFENSDIKNVAISGPYAAGKSSVIESYEKENKNLKFLHISLANFNATEKSDMQNLDNNHTNVKESILEGKILNQLLHQIDVSKIPQTNFRVKHKVSDKNILKATIISIIFILAISHIYFYHRWYDFVSGLVQFKFLRFLQLTMSSISLLFSGLLATIIASMAIYKLIKMQRDKSIFKRFKFQGNEIEIFEKNDESYFDKYLNEVLYLFDNSDADAIVFEDMDRYNVNQIFQRLREVNTLINSRRIKESNSSLKFFYLLRDDIFTSKDRTKFFDFIIPVVPILDSSNSYDQFITHLKKGQVFEKFDKHFLQGISLYIDDMRILKNVYNEFMIYYNKIGTTEQDYNKLLAIIAYKNIFPRDFSDTQINIGFVSTLFNNREKIIENNLIKTNKKIEEIEEKIVSCKNEILKDTNELDIVYRSKGYFNTNNSEYIRRKKIIDMNNEKCMDDLSKQVTELKLEKSKLSNKKLKELITRENADEIFNICYKNFIGPENAFKEIKSSQYFDLIKYLIINGYIDETYEDYMTYFYPNSLTKKDKIFLRSVTDRKAKEWEYKIDKCQIVISMLREVDFHEKETLNFSLFSYLSNTKQIEVNKKYLIAFIEQLKKGKNFYFVKEFFDFVRENRDYILIYIEIINKYWPSFLHEIIDESTFTDEWRKEYIVLTLTYCNEDIINSINEDNFLSIIISSDPQFLDIKDPKVERLIDKFLHLNIKFQKIEYEKCKDLNEDLFHAVYCNKLYDFTFENISVMLKYIYIVQDDNEIIHKNYSLIIGDKGSKLFEYVSENIDHYIRIVIDNCKGSINDTSEAALNLINNSQVEYLKKQEYIQFLTTGLKSLEDINEKKLWNLFLQKNLIKYSENNILEYYFKSENGLDDVLVNFINTNEESLKFSPDKIDLKFGENSSSELFDDIVICNTLNDNKYKDIINDLNYAFQMKK